MISKELNTLNYESLDNVKTRNPDYLTFQRTDIKIFKKSPFCDRTIIIIIAFVQTMKAIH